MKGTTSSNLSTQLLEDPHHVASFASFLVARKVVSSTLIKHLSTIRKVLVWRQSQATDAAVAIRLQAVLTWLEVLQKQCHNAAMPSQAPAMHHNLPHAKEVIAWQLRVEEAAAQAMAFDIGKFGKMFRASTARACMDAAQLAMMFGYLPPLRLGCVRTALHPDHVQASGGCMDEECKMGSTCQGNRLTWGADKKTLRACFPHHKNESKWDHLPIEFELPEDLTKQLMPYITEGHKILAPATQRLLFVHPNSGKGLTNVNMSHVSKQEIACCHDISVFVCASLYAYTSHDDALLTKCVSWLCTSMCCECVDDAVVPEALVHL